jgi:hypothetical protein
MEVVCHSKSAYCISLTGLLDVYGFFLFFPKTSLYFMYLRSTGPRYFVLSLYDVNTLIFLPKKLGQFHKYCKTK